MEMAFDGTIFNRGCQYRPAHRGEHMAITGGEEDANDALQPHLHTHAHIIPRATQADANKYANTYSHACTYTHALHRNGENNTTMYFFLEGNALHSKHFVVSLFSRYTATTQQRASRGTL
jgi:hypothetical protein